VLVIPLLLDFWCFFRGSFVNRVRTEHFSQPIRKHVRERFLLLLWYFFLFWLWFFGSFFRGIFITLVPSEFETRSNPAPALKQVPAT
jgi:hypothetical protein